MTQSYPISLNSIDKVKTFAKEITPFAGLMHLDLQSERYIVDATSILGIFSLNLSQPLTLILDTDNDELMTQAFNVIEKYIIN